MDTMPGVCRRYCKARQSAAAYEQGENTMHPKVGFCLPIKGQARKRPPAEIVCSDASALHRHHGITVYSAMAGDDHNTTNTPKNIPYVKRCSQCGGKMYDHEPFDKELHKNAAGAFFFFPALATAAPSIPCSSIQSGFLVCFVVQSACCVVPFKPF